MSNIFLAKIKNSDDRDVVKYLEFNGFECDHYFGGLNLHGACFSGFEKEFREIVENDFDRLETILTKEDYNKLFALNDELKALGFGIEKNSDKYNRGTEIVEEFKSTIGVKLASSENDELFQKVIADEKEYVKKQYNLTDDEVNYIFENYGLEYQDRAIIGCVFNDFYDFVEEEKFQLGYDKVPYFNDEEFGRDMLESEYYLELESGKIVSYNY